MTMRAHTRARGVYGAGGRSGARGRDAPSAQGRPRCRARTQPPPAPSLHPHPPPCRSQRRRRRSCSEGWRGAARPGARGERRIIMKQAIEERQTAASQAGACSRKPGAQFKVWGSGRRRRRPAAIPSECARMELARSPNPCHACVVSPKAQDEWVMAVQVVSAVELAALAWVAVRRRVGRAGSGR